MARNQNPEKWVVEDIKDSGFYKINGLPREYFTWINGLYLRIGKYPRIKKENNDEVICYSYQMFVSTKKGIGTIFNDSRKIAKTYNRIK